MSIIDEKYRDKYKGAEDWLAEFIDSQVKTVVTKVVPVKDEEGNPTGENEEVPTKRSKLDLDKLFALCAANGVPTADMEAQRDRKNAPGRIRMTLGNSLRAAARKRHGLIGIDGEWNPASTDFVGENPLTENPDGSKITAPAPEAETEEA